MKQTQLPSLVIIIILTAITSIFWGALEVYRALTTKPSIDVPDQILAPLTPALDNEAVTKIQNRLFFEDSQIQTPIILNPSASPTVPPEETASPSASPSVQPSASSSPSATPSGGI